MDKFELIIFVFLNQYITNNILRIDSSPQQKKDNKAQISKEIELKNLGYMNQNSLNIMSLLERRNSKIEHSLMENESNNIRTHQSKPQEEFNKMFKTIEITQSVVFDVQKNQDDFIKEEDKYYQPPTKKNIFRRIFSKLRDKTTVNQKMKENVQKINKNDALKLKDDEIIEVINNNPNYYIINLWQNLSYKDRCFYYLFKVFIYKI